MMVTCKKCIRRKDAIIRVFNLAGKEYFEKHIHRHVRIVNGSDPVPKVPKINYYHTNNVLNIGKKKSWWFRVFRFRKWRKQQFDHSPADYGKNLNK